MIPNLQMKKRRSAEVRHVAEFTQVVTPKLGSEAHHSASYYTMLLERLVEHKIVHVCWRLLIHPWFELSM